MTRRDARADARYLLETGDASLGELWIYYWGQGGRAGVVELDAFIHGIPLLEEFETSILGWALDQRLSA